MPIKIILIMVSVIIKQPYNTILVAKNFAFSSCSVIFRTPLSFSSREFSLTVPLKLFMLKSSNNSAEHFTKSHNDSAVQSLTFCLQLEVKY